MNAVKKAFAFLSVLLYLACFTSCDVSETIEDNAVTINPEFFEEKTDVGVENDKPIYIWTDKETGVQYVIYQEQHGYAGFGGITPRLNPDGSLYVTEDVSESIKP